jgi:hypothetical protein
VRNPGDRPSELRAPPQHPPFTNFGKSGHQQIYDSSAAFLFEVPGLHLPLAVQELQMGGAGRWQPMFACHRSLRNGSRPDLQGLRL